MRLKLRKTSGMLAVEIAFNLFLVTLILFLTLGFISNSVSKLVTVRKYSKEANFNKEQAANFDYSLKNSSLIFIK